MRAAGLLLLAFTAIALVAPGPASEDKRLDASMPTPDPGASAPDELEGSTVPSPALEPGGLRVRVIDDMGAPAPGIDVALSMQVPGAGPDDQGRATSRAPDGLARIALDDLAELRARAGAMGVAFTFAIVAEVASANAARTQLEGWPSDGDEALLRLPPTGSLRVRVLTHEGAPHMGDARVAWWWVQADVAAAYPDCGYDRVSNHFVSAQGGVAQIDGVGLDVTFQLSVSAPGLGGASARGVPGPRARGEVRDVEVRLGPPLATLSVRVLDTSGRPLAGTRLHGELWHDPDSIPGPASGPARPSWFVLTTDADGVATIEHTPGRVDVAPRLDITRRSRDKDAANDEHWSIGSVRLPLALAEGETVDLGDVALAPVPVVTAGIVVDEEGAPVPNASLWLRERPTAQHGWTNLSEPRAKAGADGRFLVRGPRLPELLAVDVSAKGFTSLSAHELEVGSQGVRLVLARAPDVPPTGAVKVHVELEPEVLPLALLLRIERPRKGGRIPDWWSGRVMEVEGLAPGSYDVWLETRDGGLELTRVEGVAVEAGKVTEDLRLLPLDARGLARTVQLECVSRDGSPWRRRTLRIDSLEPRADFDEKTDDDGLVTLVLPRRIAALVVALKRDHPVQVALGASDTRVRVVLDGE